VTAAGVLEEVLGDVRVPVPAVEPN
jgi:hypothetical protein